MSLGGTEGDNHSSCVTQEEAGKLWAGTGAGQEGGLEFVLWFDSI